jgi:uncharacterized protein YjaZ
LLPHLREFIGTRLLDWAKKYEHVSVKTVLKRNHHPFLMAEYGESYPASFSDSIQDMPHRTGLLQ